MTPEVQISPSVQALGRLEFKSNLPDIRLQATKPGEAGQPSLDDFIKFQQEQSAAREKMLAERESTGLLILATHGEIDKWEKAEGAQVKEETMHWLLVPKLQALTEREIKMKYPVAVVEKYGKAKKVEGNWYTNVSPQWGFDSKYVWVDKDIQQQVDLGTNEKRTEEHKEIQKFMKEAYARLMFANLYGHLFKKSIESIGNLATLYLASVDVGREDISSLLTLPSCPEDFGKTLKSEGGVEYKSETALGKMIVSAWQIFNATGLSEKPELFKKFVAQPGWKANIGVSMGEEIFKQWFGDPDIPTPSDPKGWTPGLVSREGWNPSKPVRWDGSEKNTLKEENGTRGSRGPLLQWGNIFVREDSYENPVLYRKAVAEFLGNSETAKKAVELAWRYFRLFGSADFVGYEWYAKNEDVLNEKGEKTGKVETRIHAAIPLGSDFTSDLGKIIRPDEYFEFYHKNSRGGLPRGAYGKVTPFAVDALRGINFGEGYTLPNGTVLKERPSLHDLLFVYGVPPEKINYNKLSERAIQSPFLRFFMAAKGDEFGKGSFDKTSSKIESPELFLSPAFWEKLMSDFHVGITKENVAWNNFIKSNGKTYTLPDEGEVRRYKLEGIRTILDGIFADEISRSWDNKPLIQGTGKGLNVSKSLRGVAKQVGAIYMSHKIIDVADVTIEGLNYGRNEYERLERVRINFELS